MIRPIRFAVAGLVMAAAADAAWAHHNPMDGYDEKSPIIVNGAITKIDWSGEHVFVFIKGADGRTWKVMAAPGKTMRENGLDETSFVAGKAIIRGYQAIDKSCKPDCLATGVDVTFPDGLKVKLDGTHWKEQAQAVHDQLTGKTKP